jgi:hypothetical protein
MKNKSDKVTQIATRADGTYTDGRQGDVLILPVDSFPDGLVPVQRCTLALGEVTGHHHTIPSGATGFAPEATSVANYFEVSDAPADLVHQEHDTVTIPTGKWRSVIQSEYTPEEIRNVAD